MRIAAELHCHTLHSDGHFEPCELADSARQLGLDLVALTDHNTMSGFREMEKTGFPFIHGIEWTTYFGHMVVLGAKEFVDWREAQIDNIDEKIRLIHEAGGLAGVAHPYELGTPFCTGCYWDFNIRDWTQVDYMEVWNSDPFPPLLPKNKRAKKLWLSKLDEGLHLTPTFGRDWHRNGSALQPAACTWLEAEKIGEKEALEAIKKGRTTLSIGPDLVWTAENSHSAFAPGDEMPQGNYVVRAQIDLQNKRPLWADLPMEIDEIRLYGAHERVLGSIPGAGGECSIQAEKKDLFLRAEALGRVCQRPCSLIISAPIYLSRG